MEKQTPEKLTPKEIKPASQETTQAPPAPKTNKPLIVGLFMIILLLVYSTGYLAYQNAQLKKKQTMANQATPTSTSVRPSPTTDVFSNLPSDWSIKTSTVCDAQFPFPPKEAPYYHPVDPNREPSVTEDVGSGRYWQYREGPQALFQFTQLATTLYANDTEASGYISGAVQVYCTPNTDGYDTKQTLNQLNFYLAESQSSGIKIKSSYMTTQWNKDVYELTFEGGVFDSSQRYYLLATPSNWYLVTKKAQSQTQTVLDATTQIFENLQFLQ